MELAPFKPAAGALVEWGGAGSIPAMVAAQQQLLHAQADRLQRLVVAQCRLTGVNPLAQEMAAGALSIKIGKKPRDLLNPKAVNSMQSLFAVKDTLGKRETREISALCGLTVTQVREFFASRRTRVRKAVRLSREKALKLEASKTALKLEASKTALKLEASKTATNICSLNTEQTPLDIETHAQVVEPLSTLEPLEMFQSSSQLAEAPQSSLQQPEVQQCTATPIPVTPTGMIQPTDAKINPDSVQKETKQEEVAPGVESEDKKFLDSIFALMRKEETFSGQVKLMEWILQINNATILSWFLTMGGLTIVSTWLSQAATEEQTTVILIIFKVLLHLPLHKALPAHMSVVLQTINRLRFYRTQDISGRARNLLSRLSKVLVRSQASKKPQKDLICKQRISEILHDESWRSEVDITEEILALTEGASESRKPEPKKTPLLLTASADESYKKSPVQTKSKERRKVQLVEHPNRKAAGKNAHSARSTCTNNSRPLSADDIQKAKMRAMFMQEKYGKVDTSKVSDKPETTENKKPSGLVNSNEPRMPRSPLTSTAKQPVDPSPSTSIQNAVPLSDNPEILATPKLNIAPRETPIEKLDSKRVHWQIPPEVWIDPSWSVSAGENSKELDVQAQRNRREKETFYASPKDIPSNPKDPWDLEMDFDDSLTPEIPIEQPPDADTMEVDGVGAAPPNMVVPGEIQQVGSTSSSSLTVASGANGAASEPDLELLAVLLKNPQLVFALSSNEVGNLPTEQTVALLDMLKQTGLGLSELVNSLPNGAGVPNKPEPVPETIPTSLPSPTPPKDLPASVGWRSDFPTHARPSNSQQAHLPNNGNTPFASEVHKSFSNVVSPLPSQPYTSVSALPAHIQSNAPSLPPQSAVSVNSLTQYAAPMNNMFDRTSVHQHTQPYGLASDPTAVAIHQQPAVNKPAHEFQNMSNSGLARSLTPEPNAAAYATFPWQSGAANVASTGRSTTPDQWADRVTNSFNDASAPHLNQSAYSNQSLQSTYDAYGSSTSASSQGLNRNGYIQTSEYQMSGRNVRQRHSLSPEPGSARVYGGTQGYIPEVSKLVNYGQQSYNPPVASTDWSSGQQSYTPAEPSRDWSSLQQRYTSAESSRDRSSGQQGYTPAEPSRQWSSGQQSYTPAEPSRQWSSGQQGYTPAESSNHQWSSGQQGYTPAGPSNHRSSGQQGYTPAEPSRQWSSAQQGYTPSEPSGQQGYTPAEPSRPWSTASQGAQNPDTSRQWSGAGKQQDYYNTPSDGRSPYDQRRRRRWE
ncbi:homeobox protein LUMINIDEPENDENS-like [Triticum dicoccoides]|uniref:homeobox protein LUMINIDEPENDENS-like n=1 Tax=Triticum dicoccoides TaxID=85692 RepID=UPI00188E59B7|nr:homeobox protein LUMINIDEPENDENS-like [Triticum dicoccoides]